MTTTHEPYSDAETDARMAQRFAEWVKELNPTHRAELIQQLTEAYRFPSSSPKQGKDRVSEWLDTFDDTRGPNGEDSERTRMRRMLENLNALKDRLFPVGTRIDGGTAASGELAYRLSQPAFRLPRRDSQEEAREANPDSKKEAQTAA